MNKDVIYLPEEGIKKAVESFETPFFIYEEKRLRDNCRRFKNAFTKYFPDFHVLYAVKANNNPSVLKIVKDEGFGFDCSSESEAWICEKIGGWGMYTGNYTTADEFAFVKNKNLTLNLDDVSMLDTVAKLGMPETLSLRINPGIGDGSEESFVTAGPKAKYGVPFEKAPEAYARAKDLGVKHFGIHMMTGTNIPIEKKKYFAEIVEKLFEVVAKIKQETDIEIEFMNIGGGFGVPYRPEESSLNLEEVAKSIREVVDNQCKKYGLNEPKMIAEPGRLIAADAGWLVSKVHVIKDSYKKFVGIDASSNDMPRPSIYGAYHYISVMKKAENDAAKNVTEIVSVVGRICENNDQLARDRELPKCEIGDVIVIHNCGGHAYTMGHNYNGKIRHAEYLLQENGEIKLIRRAETIEDLYKTTDGLDINI